MVSTKEIMDVALKLIGLAVLLYIAIWVNLFVMKISIPSYINYLIIAIIIVLVLIEALLTYNKTIKNKYYFFPGRIEFKGKQLDVNLCRVIRYVPCKYRKTVRRGLLEKLEIIYYPFKRAGNVCPCLL